MATAAGMIIEVFEKLGILYHITGPLASSALGMARSTLDMQYLRTWAALPGLTSLPGSTPAETYGNTGGGI